MGEGEEGCQIDRALVPLNASLTGRYEREIHFNFSPDFRSIDSKFLRH